MKRIKYKLNGYWHEVPLIELPSEVEAVILEETVGRAQLDELLKPTPKRKVKGKWKLRNILNWDIC